MADSICFCMNEFNQLASAMLVLVFAAAMLVVGQLYIENKGKSIFCRSRQPSDAGAIESPPA
jgi:hypothetical protein